MKKMNGVLVSVVFMAALFMSIFIMPVSIVSASDYPIIQITCAGCYSKIEGTNIFYAETGKKITLAGSGTSDYPIVGYEWRTAEGAPLISGNILQIAVNRDTSYIFVAKDGKGRENSETVEVRLKTENLCLPSYEIIISDDLNKVEWASGDAFYLEGKFEKTCSFGLNWTTGNPYVEMASPNSKKTQVKIKKGISPGTAVIVKLMISNKLGSKEEETELKIVSNSPPQVDAKFPDYITSFGHFDVDCSESKEGNSRYENDDFISKCVVSFAGGANNTVAAKRGEVLRKIRVYTGESGVYPMNVTVEDSHGKTSTKIYEVPVFMGATGKDPIKIYVSNETYCLTGGICRISAEETQIYDKRVSGFSFFLVLKSVKEQLKNNDGSLCSGPVCSHTFQEHGKYTVEIQGYTFKKEKTGYKTVTVIVSGQTPTPTVAKISPTTPTAVKMPATTTKTEIAPRETIPYHSYPAQKSPGMEAIATFVALIAAVWIAAKK